MQTAEIGNRIYLYAKLMRLHRPIGILLLLWPTLWALWIAGNGRPDSQVFVVFVAGVVLMRSAGCVINDYADRDIDPHVQRTAERPLAAGLVSGKEALLLFAVLSLLAFALVLSMNALTIQLSVIGVLLAASYPFAKRWTHWPQLHLGVAFGWAVPMVFAAEADNVPALAWLLFTATVLWACVYDTMYAMVDRVDDLRIGVKSTAILFGRADRLMIALLQILLFVVLIVTGMQAGLGGPYWLGLTVAAGFSLYQQYLIRERDPARCFQAFLNNNGFGLVIFVGIALDYVLRA